MAKTCVWFRGNEEAHSLQTTERKGEVTHWEEPVGKQSQV
jgi:hypothetical protein